MAQQVFVGTLSINGAPPQSAVFVGEVAPAPPGTGGPPVPTHPIYYPPGIWGGGNEPFPTPPIVIIPPGAIDGEHPEHPIFLPVYPSHPIELPPEQPADPGFQWVYTDQYGWVMDPVGGGKPRPLPPGGGSGGGSGGGGP